MTPLNVLRIRGETVGLEAEDVAKLLGVPDKGQQVREDLSDDDKLKKMFSKLLKVVLCTKDKVKSFDWATYILKELQIVHVQVTSLNGYTSMSTWNSKHLSCFTCALMSDNVNT